MYNFHRILIILDQSDHDKELIQAASLLSHLAGTKEVHFVNVIQNTNIPAAIKKEFPNILEDAIKERKEQLLKEIERYYTYEEAKQIIDIESGQETKSILKYSAKNGIDLIITGRKSKRSGSDVLVQRLARRAGCSLLIVPKQIKNKKNVTKVLVPVDFSNHSKDALEQAIQLLRKDLLKPKLLIQHVYEVPTGYHYTGKSYSEFAKVMEDNAKKDYGAFMKQIDTSGIKIETIFSLDRHEDFISVVHSTAKKENVDVILIGAKGRDSTTPLFIGSSAEKMVQVDLSIPVLIVRPKGKQKSIIDVLREI